MGAAHADQTLDGRELDKVRKLMCQAMRAKKLPPRLEKRMKDFDPKTFDLSATVSRLILSDDKEKRSLLELVVGVHDADGTWDFDEDDYLRRVASELLLDESVLEGLVVDVLSVESAGAALLPPPLDSDE